jgi:uncharacterized protein
MIAFIVGFVMRSVFGKNNRNDQYEPPAIDIPKQSIIGKKELGLITVILLSLLLPNYLVQDWLGNNSMLASFLATLIGAASYFATMTEAPFVDMLLGLGMGIGPAITLLLVGPGISLPNWLAIARVFGVKKAMVYVPVIIIAGTLAGWFFGNFIL